MPSRDPGAVEVFRPRVLGWSAGLLLAPLLVGAFLLRAPRPIYAREDGASVAAIFDIQVAPFDGWVRIDLAPSTDRRVIAYQKSIDSDLVGNA